MIGANRKIISISLALFLALLPFGGISADQHQNMEADCMDCLGHMDKQKAELCSLVDCFSSGCSSSGSFSILGMNLQTLLVGHIEKIMKVELSRFNSHVPPQLKRPPKPEIL